MPYVKQERRAGLDRVVEEMVRAELTMSDIVDMLRIIGNKLRLPNQVHISGPKAYESVLDTVRYWNAKPNGDLNYILFKYAKYHIKPSYNNYKNYIGAIQRAVNWLSDSRATDMYEEEYREVIAEIRRRILAKYEDEKIEENGDV